MVARATFLGILGGVLLSASMLAPARPGLCQENPRQVKYHSAYVKRSPKTQRYLRPLTGEITIVPQVPAVGYYGEGRGALLRDPQALGNRRNPFWLLERENARLEAEERALTQKNDAEE